MAENLRGMLANRRFAIPLIALLGICFVGLLLLGFVFILPSLKAGSEPVAQAAATHGAVAIPTTIAASATATVPPATATPKATATLVPIGTVIGSGAVVAETPILLSSGAGTTVALAAATQSTAEVQATTTTEASATSQPEEDELADTGIGWGLILFSGVGLAFVVLAARRLRLAS
jgi:hypothetical protein